MEHFDVLIVGGGAAGFFAAINIAEMNPNLNIAILERGNEGLQKVNEYRSFNGNSNRHIIIMTRSIIYKTNLLFIGRNM